MRLHKFILLLFLFVVGPLMAQHQITIQANLVPETHSIEIVQTITYTNTSSRPLEEIYLNDWANSFSNKTTPLAERFGENYVSLFHFEQDEKRGRTTIHSISNKDGQALPWEYEPEDDIIRVDLDGSLYPERSYELSLMYTVKLPDAKFTRFGVTKNGDYYLKYWYISPAVFDGKWNAYSNKNTEDLYLTPSTFSIEMTTPENYHLTSELDLISESTDDGQRKTKLLGLNRTRAWLYLERANTFEAIETDMFTVVTNIQDKKVTPAIKALAIDRIVYFLHNKLGSYPFKRMVISDACYRLSPVYGLNQLPDFISPFPNGFEYDIQQMKTITRMYIENTLGLNPREDHWLIGALQIHLMMEYVNTYYPGMKILGNLSNVWVIRWSHASKMEFNDQYPILYLNMARNNLHQALITPKDSLVKFNKNIASDYYAGDGFQYLQDYLGEASLERAIKQFFMENKLQPVKASTFQGVLEQNTELPVNWFFEDYVGKRTTIDFKIKAVEKQGDSLRVTIENRRDNELPISLYGLNKKEIVYKTWVPPVDSLATVTVPAKDIRKLAVNYEGVVPEFNQRNNYKNVNGGLLNRPLQFRLFQDIEDPQYNQVFLMPIFEYNLYDGLTIGPKLYNKTLLRRPLHWKIEPQYGTRSKSLIGKGSVVYTHNFEGNKPFVGRLGVSGSLFSYNEGLFYRRVTPYATLAFRNPDLRSNERQFLTLRSVNVFRDLDPTLENQDPNYSVQNIRYTYSNPNLIDHFTGQLDFELSSNFTKLSTEIEYRKLFLNNRQLNLRLFAGAFLSNQNLPGDDFFSFALDRPTDYLFDYNYYGRSEDSGLFSQQLIIAEGGFKSQLEPAFADNWIATINASTNIWKWILLYGDVGLVNNRGQGTTAVFDSGIRMNLVFDYFEIYFPLYSSLGWEPGLGNYDQRIRFIVTLSANTLFRLFTREWY